MAFTVKQIRDLQAAGVNSSNMAFTLGFADAANYLNYLKQIEKINAEARALKLSPAETNELIAAYTHGGRTSAEIAALGLVHDRERLIEMGKQIEALFQEISNADANQQTELSAKLREDVKVLLNETQVLKQKFEQILSGDLKISEALDRQVAEPVAKPAVENAPAQPEAEKAAEPAPVEQVDPSSDKEFVKLEQLLAEYKGLKAEVSALRANGALADSDHLSELESRMSNTLSSLREQAEKFDYDHISSLTNAVQESSLTDAQKQAHLTHINAITDEAALTLQTTKVITVDNNATPTSAANNIVTEAALRGNPNVASVKDVMDIGDPNNSPFMLRPDPTQTTRTWQRVANKGSDMDVDPINYYSSGSGTSPSSRGAL